MREIKQKVLKLILDLVDEGVKANDPRFGQIADGLVKEWVKRFDNLNPDDNTGEILKPEDWSYTEADYQKFKDEEQRLVGRLVRRAMAGEELIQCPKCYSYECKGECDAKN